MTRFFVQREAGIRETVTALTAALGVGGLSFYLVRMLLAREDLESNAPQLEASQLEAPKPRRRGPNGSEG